MDNPTAIGINPTILQVAGFVGYLSLFIAIGLFARAAWTDFQRWKIENRNVLLLILAYAPYAGASLLGNPSTDLVNLQFDLLSALLLFTTGFIFWQLRLFGAGDAKLMFPVGLFVGWDMLFVFAINLEVFAVIFTVLLKLPLPLVVSNTSIGVRIDEIRATNKVPYGVVLVCALYLTLLMKFA